jgi:hypothetical protein
MQMNMHFFEQLKQRFYPDVYLKTPVDGWWILLVHSWTEIIMLSFMAGKQIHDKDEN